MNTKDKVLNDFSKEEHNDVIKIYENMHMAYTRDITIFSSFFCAPNIWTYFIKNFSSKDFSVKAVGGIPDGDRRIITFNNIYNVSFPYRIIKIEINSKFGKASHRDYLGSIMSLGIDRQKFGDLRVDQNFAVVAVYEDVADYIINNLSRVRNLPVKVSVVLEEDVPEAKFENINIIIASLRIDAIVSKISNISRADAVKLIESNKILVDYNKINDKSQEIKMGEKITIGGKGKFIIGNIDGTTKSGKIRVNIKKYI